MNDLETGWCVFIEEVFQYKFGLGLAVARFISVEAQLYHIVKIPRQLLGRPYAQGRVGALQYLGLRLYRGYQRGTLQRQQQAEDQ